jgi:hypothetical protein
MIITPWEDVLSPSELAWAARRYKIYTGESEPKTHLPLSPYHGILLKGDVARDLTVHAVGLTSNPKQLGLMLGQIEEIHYEQGVLQVPMSHPWYKKAVGIYHPNYKRIRELKIYFDNLQWCT